MFTYLIISRESHFQLQVLNHVCMQEILNANNKDTKYLILLVSKPQ